MKIYDVFSTISYGKVSPHYIFFTMLYSIGIYQPNLSSIFIWSLYNFFLRDSLRNVSFVLRKILVYVLYSFFFIISYHFPTVKLSQYLAVRSADNLTLINPGPLDPETRRKDVESILSDFAENRIREYALRHTFPSPLQHTPRRFLSLNFKSERPSRAYNIRRAYKTAHAERSVEIDA